MEGVSHDAVSDFLQRERLTPRQRWELVRGRISASDEAFLLADDSLQDKCGFRVNSATDSLGKLPLIPRQGCHPSKRVIGAISDTG